MKKIKCIYCGKENNIRRFSCWMCGKKICDSEKNYTINDNIEIESESKNKKVNKKVNQNIKKNLLIIFSILSLIIIIGSILFFTTTLNEYEKITLNIIEKFEDEYLKYPKTAQYEEIILRKNDNINEISLKFKFRAKNYGGDYIEDYVYIAITRNKIDKIETQLGYELNESDKSLKYGIHILQKINGEDTPYNSLKDDTKISDFLGVHYMGHQTKQDFVSYNAGVELDEFEHYINVNKIMKRLEKIK